MNTKMIKSFIKQTVAAMTGDTDTETAEKNWRRAVGIVKGQLASIDAKQPDLEVEVEDAKERLNAAKYPTTSINDASRYLRNIVEAQEELETAEENLAELQESKKYWEDLLKEFLAEEPAEA